MSSQLLDRTEPFALTSAAGHDDGASAVCVVLDIGPGAWHDGFGAGAAAAYETTVDALCAFVRAMLLSHWPVSLDLSVVCTAPGAPFLLRSRGGARSAQLPRDVAPRLRSALGDATAAAAAATAAGTAHCSLTGALSRALCHVRRRRRELAAALAPRSKGAVDARLVCLRVAGADDYAEYVPFMNAVFAAQKEDVTIDAVAIATPPPQQAPPPVPLLSPVPVPVPAAPEDALPSLLSQAAHMTAGVFTTATPAALLETLLVCRFPPPFPSPSLFPCVPSPLSHTCGVLFCFWDSAAATQGSGGVGCCGCRGTGRRTGATRSAGRRPRSASATGGSSRAGSCAACVSRSSARSRRSARRAGRASCSRPTRCRSRGPHRRGSSHSSHSHSSRRLRRPHRRRRDRMSWTNDTQREKTTWRLNTVPRSFLSWGAKKKRLCEGGELGVAGERG